MVQLKIVKLYFDDIWQKYSKYSRTEFACFSFCVGLLSLSTFRLLNLKHTNSILQYFEYICQKSSKSIFIISSYTVSKLTHFLRQSLEIYTLSAVLCSSTLQWCTNCFTTSLWHVPHVGSGVHHVTHGSIDNWAPTRRSAAAIVRPVPGDCRPWSR